MKTVASGLKTLMCFAAAAQWVLGVLLGWWRFITCSMPSFLAASMPSNLATKYTKSNRGKIKPRPKFNTHNKQVQIIAKKVNTSFSSRVEAMYSKERQTLVFSVESPAETLGESALLVYIPHVDLFSKLKAPQCNKNRRRVKHWSAALQPRWNQHSA